MNRRRFIKSLAAALTLPAAPVHLLKPAAAALPSANAAAAAALATKARFWAIYMYGLQGNCTPATLSTILNIPETEASNHLTGLIADGVIKPHALLRNSVTKLVKSGEDKVARGTLRDRMEMKRKAIAPETDGDTQSVPDEENNSADPVAENAEDTEHYMSEAPPSKPEKVEDPAEVIDGDFGMMEDALESEIAEDGQPIALKAQASS